jgi:UDP-GlcNAc:undecaprenyl-phosphate GlcNAc-1-phosphate transferase
MFLVAFALSLLLVPLVKKLAAATGAVDVPNSPRKIHRGPIPLLGGLAVYAAFLVAMVGYLLLAHPDFHVVPLQFYVGIALGGAVLMVGGFLDDCYSLPPNLAFIAPVVAAGVVVWSGIGVGITQISNPFGHAFMLNFLVLGVPFSAVFIFVFILGMIYTTKFLDGMDGLASGISLIASLTLFALSLTPRISQGTTASLAIAFSGALLGFLVYNFNPASIFLGEAGSTLCGFMLGVLSVLLGGKIATAVLVMGIPIMDVAWVVVRRMWFGSSPFKADRKHLHFRLLDIGFTQRQTVLILYGIAAGFGLVAIFLQSLGKLVALVVLLGVMLFLAISTVVAYKHRYPHVPEI